MLLMYNYVLLKMSTWYSKHVEESNNIWRINSIQCITLVVLYGQFMMHGQRNIKEGALLWCVIVMVRHCYGASFLKPVNMWKELRQKFCVELFSKFVTYFLVWLALAFIAALFNSDQYKMSGNNFIFGVILQTRHITISPTPDQLLEKTTAQNTTRSNHCIILLSSWWWA